CGSARRTEKPSPRSRTRGTMTSSSASQDRLSPSTGSADGSQLIAFLRSRSAVRHACTCRGHPCLCSLHNEAGIGTPFIPAQAGIQGSEAVAPGSSLSRGRTDLSSSHSLRDSPRPSRLFYERALVHFGERLLQLGLGVHPDGPIPHNRLFDRFAGDQQEPD